jgi:hypothetical protein
MNMQGYAWDRYSKGERAVVRKVYEASGDAVWIVEGRTREALARYKIEQASSLNRPQWRTRIGPKRYELQAPHGVVWVREHRGAAIFVRLEDAKAAAELHASDGGTSRSNEDDLCWDDDLCLDDDLCGIRI